MIPLHQGEPGAEALASGTLADRAGRVFDFLLAALAGAALCLAAGCTRDLSLPKPAVRGIGVSCEKDAQCDGNRCREGVCCASECAGHETCTAPGHAGTCTARALGAACQTHAQCGPAVSPGLCVDGVCCESACAGTCSTCASAEAPGRCRQQANNHDDRKLCGQCLACFLGTCAPALPGTDPGGQCGGGKVCSARQQCGAAVGGLCATSDDCAVGDCLASACSALTRERVTSVDMVTAPTGRRLKGLATTAGGTVAVLYAEFSTEDGTAAGLTLENDLWLALRAPAGGWSANPILRDLGVPAGDLVAALASVGEFFFLAKSSKAAENQGCQPASTCGVNGDLLSPAGQVARSEAIDPAVRDVFEVALERDASGAVFVFYDGLRDGAQRTLFARRGILGAGSTNWVDVGSAPRVDGMGELLPWAATVVDGQPTFFTPDKLYGTTLVATAGGAVVDTIDTSAVCNEIDSLSVVTAAAPEGTEVLIGLSCARASGFAIYRPWKPQGQRGQALAAPQYTELLQPLGRIGAGEAVLLAGTYDADLTTLQLDFAELAADGTFGVRQIWAPRGPEDLRDFTSLLLGPLPTVLLLTGPVTPPGGTTAPGVSLELVRYRR